MSHLEKKLLFRRQFVLGPRAYSPNDEWRVVSVGHGMVLSVHRDLPFHVYVCGSLISVIVGIAVDAERPALAEEELLKQSLNESSSWEDAINLSHTLCGRWVLIFGDRDTLRLLGDPCGLRSVFYLKAREGVWIGSQPNIIAAVTRMKGLHDVDMVRFVESKQFSRREQAWVGSKTPYEGCFRLLPNTWLDIAACVIQRLPARRELVPVDYEAAVRRAANMFKKIMTALVARERITLAVTAGYDSRLLLAACRDVVHEICLFTDRQGVLPEDHPDVIVPVRVARNLGLSFEVRNSRKEPDGSFLRLMKKNVFNVRSLPKTRMIYGKWLAEDERLNVSGNVSGICKRVYHDLEPEGSEELSAYQMADMLGYRGQRFAVRELDAWLGESDILCPGLTRSDMLYWEQRMGNWGAQFPAEQDLVADEISPYNCRALIEIMAATDPEMRSAPRYQLYTDMMELLWPQVLSVPFNPLGRGPVEFMKGIVKSSLPKPWLRAVKKIL